MTRPNSLILILGDQLTPDIASLRGTDRTQSVLLMAEVADEASYVPHHRKKLAFLFSAMRHFADEMRRDGWQVDYVRLDDPENRGSLAGEVERARERYGDLPLRVTEAGEWRLAEAMRSWPNCQVVADERFFSTLARFAAWTEGRKTLRMEFFYRMMRRQTGLLMDGGAPIGGRWNFDVENRKPAERDLLMPRPRPFPPDAITQEVIAMVESRFPDNFGALSPFAFAVTRDDAEAAFDDFVAYRLARFGDHQDAMLTGEPFLYHAVIAQYLNCGLLDARRICARVDDLCRTGRIPVNAAEGFIRQILGWREYVRGIYWLRMPGYAGENHLGATRSLPDFYWTADTDMACVSACVRQTRDEAYAHHIQRLMVTGNFALLAGVDPAELHRWYLAVYADAYEWVELPNTLGMSQFDDGGLLASKPYAASGAYINRMSDYCRSCRFDVKKRTGPQACPFNFLYWDFVARHAERLGANARMQPVLHSWNRFAEREQTQIRREAHHFLDAIDGGHAQ